MRRAWLVAALLCACREQGAAPVPPAESPAAPAPPERIREQEPNDFQRAQQIPARAVVTGSLEAPRDDDWFRVGVPAGKTLALRIELKLVRDASIEAYDRDRNRLLRVHAGGGDPGVIPALACLEACFLKVSGAGPHDYELAVLGAEPRPDEELEPNDRAVDATSLQPGKPMRGTYLSADDEDWYRLELKPSAMDALRIEVTAVAGARPELEVRALADASLLATFRGTDELLVRDLSVHLADLRDGGLADQGIADGVDADGGGEKPLLLARVNEGGPREPEVLPAVGIPAGDSYLLVQAAARQLEGKWVRDGEDRQTPYRLAVQLFADDGSTEREPNDEVATAPVLALPIQVKGWIWPRKDVDVFRFHVGAGHAPVNLVLPAVRGVDLQLRLYQLRGERPPEVIGSSDARRGEGEEKLIAVPLKEGDYAVEVSSPRNKDASATQAYALTVQ